MSPQPNLLLLDNALWILTTPTNVVNYDFPFEQFFTCQHPWERPPQIEAIARTGAVLDYSDFYNQCQSEGIALIHTPEQHARCSELPEWYPLLKDITPKSLWFSERPRPEDVMRELQWPIFMKGARQTSKHRRKLSIIENADEFVRALDEYANDPILNWQQIVCREYVRLRPIASEESDEIPASFEFRTFWWRGKLVGAGRYWYAASDYTWNAREQTDALAVAQEAAERVDVPFLVVDVAQRIDGQWIVIECNDGQESGYAGVSPISLWNHILALESQ